MIHRPAAPWAGRFDRPRRRLRADLVQLLFAVAGLGLGLLLPRITVAPTVVLRAVLPHGSQVRRQSAATVGAGQIAGRQRCVPYPVERPVA